MPIRSQYIFLILLGLASCNNVVNDREIAGNYVINDGTNDLISIAGKDSYKRIINNNDGRAKIYQGRYVIEHEEDCTYITFYNWDGLENNFYRACVAKSMTGKIEISISPDDGSYYVKQIK
jgi:hypothetical protein